MAQGLLALFALGEYASRANLVGEIDGKRDHHGPPAVGVNAVEVGAPPTGLALGGIVAELGHVLRRAGRGHFLDE